MSHAHLLRNAAPWSVALVTAFATALSSAPASGAPPAPGAQTSPARDVATAGPVLASFEGGALTKAHYEQAVASKHGPVRARIAAPGGRERFLRELVEFELLVREAERRGYAQHRVVVQKAREAAVESLLAAEETAAEAAITDAEIAARYAEQPERWKRKAMRRARHVQVGSETEAKRMLDELRAHDAKTVGSVLKHVERLARERSTDATSAKQSGELGYFDAEGKRQDGAAPIDPALAQAAFALRNVGDLAGPLRTPAGYSVLVLTAELEAIDRPLANAAGEIRIELAAKRRQQNVDALVTRTRNAANVEVHPERVAPIALDRDPSQAIPQGFPAAPRDPSEPTKTVEPDGF